MKNYCKNAFSLVEISVVILIVGILIAGVSQGIDLYKDIRLSMARNLTQNSRVGRIPDLAVWLETVSTESFDKNEAIENSTISKWIDINPVNNSDNYASVNSQASKPIYNLNCINNLPALKFDGINDYLISNIYGIQKTKSITYFVVTKRIKEGWAFSTFNVIATNSDNDSNLVAFNENTGNQLRPWTQDGQAGFIIPHPGNNVPYIASSIFTGTTNTIYLNGVKSIYANSTNFNITKDFDLNRIILGSRWSSNSAVNFYNGCIGEIIIFSRDLTSAEHDSVSNYLRKKWGI